MIVVCGDDHEGLSGIPTTPSAGLRRQILLSEVLRGDGERHRAGWWPGGPAAAACGSRVGLLVKCGAVGLQMVMATASVALFWPCVPGWWGSLLL